MIHVTLNYIAKHTSNFPHVCAMNETDDTQYSPGEALISAVHFGNYQGVEEALSRGADVDYRDEKGCTALMGAAEQNLPKNAKRLLEVGASVHAKDDDGNTPLHHFCISDELDFSQEVLGLLLDAGADIEARNCSDNTPLITLMLAVRMGHNGSKEGQVHVAERLIERGADVLARGNNGLTALDVLSFIEEADPRFQPIFDQAILRHNTLSPENTRPRARL